MHRKSIATINKKQIVTRNLELLQEREKQQMVKKYIFKPVFNFPLGRANGTEGDCHFEMARRGPIGSLRRTKKRKTSPMPVDDLTFNDFRINFLDKKRRCIANQSQISISRKLLLETWRILAMLCVS